MIIIVKNTHEQRQFQSMSLITDLQSIKLNHSTIINNWSQ